MEQNAPELGNRSVLGWGNRGWLEIIDLVLSVCDKGTLKTHLATIDSWLGWEHGMVYYLFVPPNPEKTEYFLYAPILERAAVLLALWLICLWMYRRKIFLKI